MGIASETLAFVTLAKKEITVGKVFLFIVAALYSVSLYVNTISMHNMSESIVESNNRLVGAIGYAAKKSSTDASMEVVMYGLKDSHTQEQIIDKMKWWKKNDWGAQIGDSKNICTVYPERLDDKMTEHTRKLFCRIALSM